MPHWFQKKHKSEATYWDKDRYYNSTTLCGWMKDVRDGDEYRNALQKWLWCGESGPRLRDVVMSDSTTRSYLCKGADVWKVVKKIADG